VDDIWSARGAALGLINCSRGLSLARAV